MSVVEYTKDDTDQSRMCGEHVGCFRATNGDTNQNAKCLGHVFWIMECCTTY